MKEEVVELLMEMSAASRRRGDAGRANAYAQAARALAGRDDFDALLAGGRLQSVPGVGASVETIVRAFVERGERPAVLAPRDAAPQDPDSLVAAFLSAPFSGVPDLHCHTTWSDGALTLNQLLGLVRQMGLSTVGVSDHSGSLRVARGLDPSAVRSQWHEIDEARAKHPDLVILKGTECDILRNGSLDHPEELLAGFDYVIAAVHTDFKLTKAQQTARVLRAIESPHVTILGHPTAVKRGVRGPMELDIDKVFEAAAASGVAVEINGNPGRLDLDVALARRALAAGARLALGSDAHDASDLFSIATARAIAHEAGATEKDIINFDYLSDPPPVHL